jgi:hypothetical protein
MSTIEQIVIVLFSSGTAVALVTAYFERKRFIVDQYLLKGEELVTLANKFFKCVITEHKMIDKDVFNGIYTLAAVHDALETKMSDDEDRRLRILTAIYFPETIKIFYGFNDIVRELHDIVKAANQNGTIVINQDTKTRYRYLIENELDGKYRSYERQLFGEIRKRSIKFWFPRIEKHLPKDE